MNQPMWGLPIDRAVAVVDHLLAVGEDDSDGVALKGDLFELAEGENVAFVDLLAGNAGGAQRDEFRRAGGAQRDRDAVAGRSGLAVFGDADDGEGAGRAVGQAADDERGIGERFSGEFALGWLDLEDLPSDHAVVFKLRVPAEVGPRVAGVGGEGGGAEEGARRGRGGRLSSGGAEARAATVARARMSVIREKVFSVM